MKQQPALFTNQAVEVCRSCGGKLLSRRSLSGYQWHWCKLKPSHPYRDVVLCKAKLPCLLDHRMVSVAVSPSNPPGQCGWSQSGLRGGRADGSTWQRPAVTTPASVGRSPEGQTGEKKQNRIVHSKSYEEVLFKILKRHQLQSSGYLYKHVFKVQKTNSQSYVPLFCVSISAALLHFLFHSSLTLPPLSTPLHFHFALQEAVAQLSHYFTQPLHIRAAIACGPAPLWQQTPL